MKASERGLLVGVVLVLAGAVAWIVWRGVQEEPAKQGRIDVSRLPEVGPVVRAYETPGGVKVQVLQEGDGEVRKPGEAMDLAYTGYIGDSGSVFERNVYHALVLENGGVIQGWIEGLQGMRPRERRRLFVPNALAYQDMRVGRVRPGADLVYDVQWAALKKEDLVEGSGDLAREGDPVTVHYKGMLENGETFDSSYKRGAPSSFTLRRGRGGVIEGWVLGIPGMRAGGKRRLWIPWHLAYADKPPKGAQPGMAHIPAFANLVFEVELVSVP